jgi:hypothetical protein
MTPAQRDLARHALGLTGRQQTSYRNSFVAGPNHDDFAIWQQMVTQGLATRRDAKSLPFGGNHLYRLTPAGARAALLPGEALDPEDFPA